MTCQECSEAIEQAANREITADRLRALEEHVAACASCRVLYEGNVRLSQMLSQVGVPQVSEEFPGRMAAFAAQTLAANSRPRPARWPVPLAAAAGLALGMLIGAQAFPRLQVVERPAALALQPPTPETRMERVGTTAFAAGEPAEEQPRGGDREGAVGRGFHPAPGVAGRGSPALQLRRRPSRLDAAYASYSLPRPALAVPALALRDAVQAERGRELATTPAGDVVSGAYAETLGMATSLASGEPAGTTVPDRAVGTGAEPVLAPAVLPVAGRLAEESRAEATASDWSAARGELAWPAATPALAALSGDSEARGAAAATVTVTGEPRPAEGPPREELREAPLTADAIPVFIANASDGGLVALRSLHERPLERPGTAVVHVIAFGGGGNP